MAKSQKARDETRKLKKEREGIEDLRLTTHPGDRQVIAELMAWTGDTQKSSLVLTYLRAIHALGPEKAKQLSVCRHVFDASELWSRYEAESLRGIALEPGDEIIRPDSRDTCIPPRKCLTSAGPRRRVA